MQLIRGKRLFNNILNQSAKNRMRKLIILCADSNVPQIVWKAFCPKCQNEKKMFTFQPIKTLEKVSMIAKGAKSVNIQFKEQKPTITLIGGDGTRCFDNYWLEHGYCLLKSHRDSLFLSKFQQPSDALIGRKHESDWKRQEDFSSKNSSL